MNSVGTVLNLIWLAENALILGGAVWLCVCLARETWRAWRNAAGQTPAAHKETP